MKAAQAIEGRALAEAVQHERDRIDALATRLDVAWWDEKIGDWRAFGYRVTHPEEFGDET
jgi:hypothetical protein